jgi:predicted MFS family arabinose efflux permease
MQAIARALQGRGTHYAWVVVGVTFVLLLVAAGVRATPSVLIVPLEEAFGWSRATISAAVAVNIFLYGLMGPFAAALMQSIGVRRSIYLAMGLVALSVGASTLMTAAWQLLLFWGLLVGLGVGVVAMVLGATIVNRWFATNRGLAMGLLAASTATGQLVFLPLLAQLVTAVGWQAATLLVAGAAAALIPLTALLLPERPRSVGLSPYGQEGPEAEPPAAGNPVLVALRVLRRCVRSRDFWLLFASFFVCGLSTNGLVGTHLIPACIDNGIAATSAAGLLAMMGIFDIAGTTGSGWLSDRYDNRWLLFVYYGLRGLSLIYLPFSGYSLYGLSLFAVFYGLDWLATVPPTLRLATDAFGKADAPIVFGWILTGHQIGAAVAAFGAGYLRSSLETYLQAFVIAGVACLVTAVMVLWIGRREHRERRLGAPAEAAAGGV